MKIIQNSVRISSINPIQSNKIRNGLNEFNQILEDTISSNETIKFSKHASMRLDSRNIKLSTEQIEKLAKGIEKAKEKGIKDSLVLMDQIALVVNIKNRTVVTAMDSNQNESSVFTNIDGAVIV